MKEMTDEQVKAVKMVFEASPFMDEETKANLLARLDSYTTGWNACLEWLRKKKEEEGVDLNEIV